MNLIIELKPESIQSAIEKALSVGPRIMTENPLMAALSKAMAENASRIEAWAREQVHTVLGDPVFRDQIRREIKTAMLAEAQSLGRKAARAAVNAADEGGAR